MEEQHRPEAELMRLRTEKLENLRAQGCDPFSIEKYTRYAELKENNIVSRTVDPYSKNIIALYEELEPSDKELPIPEISVSVAGRVVSQNLVGKVAFVHIEDRRGKIQIYFKRDELPEQFPMVRKFDMGDFIGVSGFVFRTKTGEVSVHAKSVELLCKSIRPIPFGKEKGDKQWYGLKDTEQRYRQRYLDLITNNESRGVFENRSKIIKCIRDFYDSRGYMEVETPVLQSVAGGAAARPFMTYHNSLKSDFHLRISLELYLKRLIVGGLERVYEIGRVFRNEGLSTRHNPEFTLMESYEAYADLDDIMQLVEELFRYTVKTLYGGTTFEYQGNTIDVAGPWRRLPMLEGIQQYAGVAPEAFDSLESALSALESLDLPTENEHTVGGIIEKIHERFVQPELIQPTFITDFPLETSPLAKKRQDNPNMVRRFEVYIGSQETGNAFSEINDPIDQRERFEAPGKMRDAGDEEAHPMDEDFLRALEYGMPPSGGLGIGVDRMVMIICNQDSIRDVILFPQMKPEG